MELEEVKLKIDGRMLNVGQVNLARKTFTAYRKRSKHFHRRLNAWGMDSGVLLELVQSGVTTVVIYDEESGVMYTAPVKAFFMHGVERDFGHGKQRFLPLKHWRVTTL